REAQQGTRRRGDITERSAGLNTVTDVQLSRAKEVHETELARKALAAAVARVALRRLASEEIAANVARQSQALRDGLAALDREFGLFAEVRGRGLMLGAVLKPEHAGQAGAIGDLAAAHGLLLLQAGPDVLRFVPALTIGADDVADGLARLREALVAFAGG
ncbi:MAG: aminotransferase class III-fold pyridoxal phosphate-dependent enzyme, partial [Thermomonas sp.]